MRALRLLGALLMLMAGSGLNAQQTFEIITENNFATYSGNIEDLPVLNIELKNTSDQAIMLKVDLLENTLLEGWDASMCVLPEACLVGIPDTMEFSPIQPDEIGTLKLNLYITANEGKGIVRFNIYDDANPELTEEVMFEVIIGVVGYQDLALNSLVLFPNPSNGQVHVQLAEANLTKEVDLRIFDLQGKEVYFQSVSEFDETLTVSTEEFAQGTYFVHLYENKQLVSTNKLVVAR